ncbi:cytochrome P450 [Xylariaceae sp. FL1272]|nr:cytochrome P450 [Xylariaceae sp. FL1272]
MSPSHVFFLQTTPNRLRWLYVLLLGNPFMTWLDILPMGHLFNTAVKAVAERQANTGARFNMVEHWLKTLLQHPERMSLGDLDAVATSAVSAGADTVSCGFQALVYQMIRHPTAWQRVRSEIDPAQIEQGICKERVISFADAQKLPYLQVCTKEALRVFGPISMGLLRTVPKQGLTISNRTFSEGTILSIHPWVMILRRSGGRTPTC